MLQRGGDGQYLVPFRTEAIDKNWRRLRNALGIDGLHFHDLRHEAATRLAEQGKTIPQIQQYTLHDDWNSLKRYVNLDIIRREVLDCRKSKNCLFLQAKLFAKILGRQNLY